MSQDLAEPEVALEEVKGKPTPLGPRHLHWVHNAGASFWIVRGLKKSPLCGTARCREVIILEVVPVKQPETKLELVIRPYSAPPGVGPVPYEYREL